MKNSHFLTSQFRYLARTYPLRRSLRHKAFIGVEAVRLFFGWLHLRWLLRSKPVASAVRSIREKCVVVLLSHNRPQNMDLLAQAALSNGFVSEVIVSNSNHNVHIADWIKRDDKRLKLIDETGLTQPGHRLVLAERSEGEQFLAVDDDIFFTPKQLEEFFACLLRDPEVPHGIVGNMYLPGTSSSNGSPFHHLSGAEQEVDVLIGAYAFNRGHLRRVFELAGILGIERVSEVRNYDDLLLSFGGTRRPWIHPIQPLYCASNSLPGVALWKSDGSFWNEREDIYRRLQEARQSVDSRRSARKDATRPV